MQCLKYLVLANMLMESAVDPFDAQEVKPYRDDPDVTAMRALVGAYQRNDITTFERLLSAHRAQVMGDDFVRDSIEDLLKNIRTQVLLNLIKPYTTITIPHISTELNIPEDDVEALVVALILDGRVDARVDQLARVVRIRRPPAPTRASTRAPARARTRPWAARFVACTSPSWVDSFPIHARDARMQSIPRPSRPSRPRVPRVSRRARVSSQSPGAARDDDRDDDRAVRTRPRRARAPSEAMRRGKTSRDRPRRALCALVVVVASSSRSARAFYLPGVAPIDYERMI